MAKDNIALLTEIAGQLRKLNQTSVRDTLREREIQQRQEAVAAGAVATSQPGPAFIDPAEDFRRRIKGSIFSTVAAEQVTASGERAKGWVKDNKGGATQAASDEAGNIAAKENKEANEIAGKTLINIQGLIKETNKILLDRQEKLDTAGRNAARSSSEDDLENPLNAGPQMPQATADWRANQREKDAAANAALATARDNTKKKTRSLATKLVIAAGVAASMSVDDVIRGWKMDGLDGAVSSYFGGSQEGGMINAIRQSFVLGVEGAAVGLMVGGPIGALVGGILGATTGAITGSIGAAKINEWMDAAGKDLTDAWSEIKTNFTNVTKKIGDWIHTPGTTEGPAGGFKSKMFGGIIEWNPTKSSGETLSSAWKSVVAKMEAAPGKFAAWLENDLRNGLGAGSGSNKLADWLFGKTDAAKKVIKNNKKFTFDDARMNPEDQPGFEVKQRLKQQIQDKIFKGEMLKSDYIGVGSTFMNELINKAGGPNVDADGNIIGTYRPEKDTSKSGAILGPGDAGNVLLAQDLVHNSKKYESEGVIEKLLDAGRSGYLSLQASRQAKKDLFLEQNGMRPRSDFGTPVIIPVSSDSSTKETNITINQDKTPLIWGSGNNANAIMGEDGFVYSW